MCVWESVIITIIVVTVVVVENLGVSSESVQLGQRNCRDLT